MNRLAFAFGLVLSAALVILLFYRIDLAGFFLAFRSANYFYLLPIVLVILFGTYLRALRWQLIIRPVKKMRFAHLFAATLIGYTANNLLPLRAGEFIRAHAIGRMERVSRTAAFATIVVERVCDGLSILVILVCLLPWLKLPAQEWLVAAAWLALLLYLLVVGLILLVHFQKRPTLKFFWFFPAAVLARVEKLADGLKIIENLSQLLVIAACSFVIWAVTALAVYFTAVAFSYQLAYLPSLFILVLMTFAVIPPSAPGFIGTLDAALVYGLMLFAVPREAALTMAVFYHGLSVLVVIVPGFYYLWKYKLSLTEI